VRSILWRVSLVYLGRCAQFCGVADAQPIGREICTRNTRHICNDMLPPETRGSTKHGSNKPQAILLHYPTVKVAKKASSRIKGSTHSSCTSFVGFRCLDKPKATFFLYPWWLTRRSTNSRQLRASSVRYDISPPPHPQRGFSFTRHKHPKVTWIHVSGA
jgi:hypothetical protein